MARPASAGRIQTRRRSTPGRPRPAPAARSAEVTPRQRRGDARRPGRRSTGNPSARSAPPRPRRRFPARPCPGSRTGSGDSGRGPGQCAASIVAAASESVSSARDRAVKPGAVAGRSSARAGAAPQGPSSPSAAANPVGIQRDPANQGPQGPERLRTRFPARSARNRSACSAVAVRSRSTTMTVRPARPSGTNRPAGSTEYRSQCRGWVTTGSAPQKTTTSARFLTSPSVAETRRALEGQDPGQRRRSVARLDDGADPVGQREGRRHGLVGRAAQAQDRPGPSRPRAARRPVHRLVGAGAGCPRSGRRTVAPVRAIAKNQSRPIAGVLASTTRLPSITARSSQRQPQSQAGDRLDHGEWLCSQSVAVSGARGQARASIGSDSRRRASHGVHWSRRLEPGPRRDCPRGSGACQTGAAASAGGGCISHVGLPVRAASTRRPAAIRALRLLGRVAEVDETPARRFVEDLAQVEEGRVGRSARRRSSNRA